MLKGCCVAHRGFSGVAPENTLAAMKLVMQMKEIQWIEIDVQLSQDGVPVVIHDFTLNRTTNGNGIVHEQNIEQLRQLDAGRWKSRLFTGQRIPTLSELLDTVQGRLKLNIELKIKPDSYPGLAQAALHEIRKRKMEQDVIFTSFVPHILLECREIAPEIRRGLIIDQRPADLMDKLREYGCDFLSIGHHRIDSHFVRSTIESGFDMMVWTVDSVRRMRELKSMHPDLMICTNRPDRWLLAQKLPNIRDRAKWRRWMPF
ncbi:glycerophosphodiester phosphodiesterase family protein [Saccharibacillus sp. JS10]|uniref:glycerophosphodiester phosphodiesterase n=1 Tax=Saccharibacillus sp. JS10 TaxID=2950552 RepID=UPI00210D28A4|nr:glycerophosphodiester phosphodiesterase family protein [Saccharibacillus sp. JS10]MCQ4086985.1 glycerophosphodiester phosphodiesterase [Saccharibacillus sp. JS10]